MLFRHVIYLFVSFDCIACVVPFTCAFSDTTNRIMISITHCTTQQTH